MERALVFLVEESSGALTLAQGRNLKRESLSQAERISKSIIEEVHQTGKPFVSANTAIDPRVSTRDSIVDLKLGTLFCGPLRAGGKILGALYADHPAAVSSIPESAINLFAAFCNLTAVAVENAITHRNLMDEKLDLENRLRFAREGSGEIIGNSPAVRQLLDKVVRVANSPLDVLILGESGTGKELVAKALHKLGRRANAKFVPVDCGSLSETLIESELFGYRRGAFTGASETRPGLLETANGGVLFLDEIGNLSLRLQGKLLRVLQEREVRRLGENSPRRIDIQFIAATNKDLREEIRRGRFRSDLFYRLNSVEIRVPPLRERTEDIPILANHFLAVLSGEGGESKRFSPQAWQLLCGHPFPGNVRQLKSAVQSAYYLSPGKIINQEHLPEEILNEIVSRPESHDETARTIFRQLLEQQGSFQELVRAPFIGRKLDRAIVRQILDLALTRCNGKYRDALTLMGVGHSDYAQTLTFLRRHGCFVDFRQYRRDRKSKRGRAS
jgi:transcriptional regulator with GAF, ATPase, and Fis domain